MESSVCKAKAGAAVREITQAMDEIVWTINPKNDTVENLASYIFQYAQGFFADSGVRCRMDLPAHLPENTEAGKYIVFLDPPYASDVRTADVYAHDSGDVASDVRAWCREHGTNPRYRIVLAGFDTEHIELESHGWIAIEWFRSGFLKGGMSKQSASGTQQHRERLWLSPACIRPRVEAPRQRALFEAVDGG